MARTCVGGISSPRPGAGAAGRAAAGERQRLEETRGLVRAAVALDVDADEVPAPAQHDELRGAAADAAREPAGAGERDGVVARAVDDERRGGDAGELGV